MKKHTLLRYLVLGTLVSILLFFSVSFVDILLQLSSPLHRYHDLFHHRFGFPFVFYEEFLGDGFIHAGWRGHNLLLDIGIYWSFGMLLTTGILHYKNKLK